MVITNIVGCIKKGTLAERPAHAAYLTDYLYYVDSGPNLGDLYWDDGSAWVLLQGAAKSEALQNKILDPTLNTMTGLILDPFITQKRQGYLIPAPTAAASLQLALKGLPSVGSYSMVYDPVEGWVCRYSTSAIEQVGFFSNVLPTFLTRRSQFPKIKIRMRSSTPTNVNMLVGFTDNVTGFQNANSPHVNNTNSIWFGMGAGYSANYIGLRTNTTGGAGISSVTSTARDALWHTFELQLNSTNITYIFDNNAPLVSSNSVLVDLNADLKLYIQLTSRDTVPKTFDIGKAYFESNLI